MHNDQSCYHYSSDSSKDGWNKDFGEQDRARFLGCHWALYNHSCNCRHLGISLRVRPLPYSLYRRHCPWFSDIQKFGLKRASSLNGLSTLTAVNLSAEQMAGWSNLHLGSWFWHDPPSIHWCMIMKWSLKLPASSPLSLRSVWRSRISPCSDCTVCCHYHMPQGSVMMSAQSMCQQSAFSLGLPASSSKFCKKAMTLIM